MTVIFEMRASIGEIKDGSRKDWDSLQNTCSSLLYWISDDSLLYRVCKQIFVCALLSLFYTDQCYVLPLHTLPE